MEEEYDGAAPPHANNHVHLAEEDLLLMWKLFDYSLTSSKPNSEFDSEGGPDSVLYDMPPESSAPSVLIVGQRHDHPSPNVASGMQEMGSSLEDIAVRSYSDRPSSGGTAFGYV